MTFFILWIKQLNFITQSFHVSFAADIKKWKDRVSEFSLSIVDPFGRKKTVQRHFA